MSGTLRLSTRNRGSNAQKTALGPPQTASPVVEVQDVEGSSGTPFRNVGLERWTEARGRWTARPSGAGQGKGSTIGSAEKRKVVMHPDELFDELTSPRYENFSERIPLGELVGVLIEVWEANGLLG